MLFAILLVGLFCLDPAFAAATCPFKRGAEAEGSVPAFDPEELARLHKKAHSEPHANKRQSSTFDPIAQKISVSGANAWAPPGPGDTRGPCPGLNALANHGYLPRSGVSGMVQAATACQQVFGLGIDAGTVLSLYATLVSGDPITQTWSIGGPPPPILGLPVLGPGNGLSGSHNKFEGDASATHYYLHNGDVSTLRISKFQALYDIAKNDAIPNYDLDVVKETLKSMYGVTESPDGTLSFTPGHERIPNNWYRRPVGALNDYTLLRGVEDTITMLQAIPGIVGVGGNTGQVNSYVGIDLGDITGGVYRAVDLLDPPKFVCYIYQLALAVVPDILRSRFLGAVLGTALNLLSDVLNPFIDPQCAKISNYNDDFAAQFPGAALGN
ncbi:Dothistromin biosynthesis peroxidase dotB [Paramyrothecium foliicola]|nr:Dothistromin biosynthesis peroxidase dotB [Paramyrothecium foliicola]